MTKTLIVPGIDNAPAPHWQHWWAETDPSAIFVEMPERLRSRLSCWESELAGAILHHPDSVLVGHGLSAVLIARVLALWPQLRIRAAMLVAPAEPRAQGRQTKLSPPAERALPVPALLVASRSNPAMSFDRARELATHWQADLIDHGDSGAIDVAAGFGPWPLGKQLRDMLLSRSTPPARGPNLRLAAWG